MTATVVIGSATYSDWKKVSVKRSMKGAAATFSLEVTEAAAIPPFTGSRRIKPGDACTIMLDGILAVTGYVDAVSYDYDENSHRVNVSGRSKTADAVDSSATLPGGGQVQGKKLDEIATMALQPFGITVKATEDTGAPFENEQAEPGETVFEFVERLSRARGFLVHDDKDGNVVLTRGPTGGAVAKLVEGINIKRGGAQHRMDERHSEIKVKGQRKGTDQVHGERAAHIEAKVTDQFVKRHRPLVVVGEDFTDIEEARNRADQEATHRAGKSVSARVTVVGWTRSPGTLWAAGELYHLASPMLAIDRDMVCQDLEFTVDDGGHIALMNLVPPEAVSTKKFATAPKSSGGSGGGSGASSPTKTTTTTPAAPSGYAVDDIWTQSGPTEPAQ